ncbi:hypothetical protein DFH06DRAFT_1200359 [Mycena polygramma]|nr:hypothetical protein DFH06DRAFT_1200359 [Mycena polygramma]
MGPSVPGSFTNESKVGEVKGGGGVAETVKGSMAQSFAHRLPSSEAEPSLTPPRPPFASVMSNLSTQAQAGSMYSSASTATLNSDNLSTMVHTGGTHSPHPVRPVCESKLHDSLDSPAVSATPSVSDISPSGAPAPQNILAASDGEFASKVADTLLAADAAASTPAPVSAFTPLGSAGLNSSRAEDNSGSGEAGNTTLNSSKAEDAIPVPAANLQSFIDATPNPSFSSSDASLATGAHGAGALPTMSLEALNSERVEDVPPALFIDANSSSLGGTCAHDVVAPDAPRGAITGSASLNSSNPNDKFPADTPASFIDADSSPSSPSTLATPPQHSLTSDSKADEFAAREDGTPESGGKDDEGGHKKPKLMQRLKDKMHIGHGHS